jgi:hypothetical protein
MPMSKPCRNQTPLTYEIFAPFPHLVTFWKIPFDKVSVQWDGMGKQDLVQNKDDDPPDPGGTVINNSNFWARYINGNRNKGIKLCHWNIGGGYLSNKIDTIETLIADYSPHILGISEASFWSHHNLEDV